MMVDNPVVGNQNNWVVSHLDNRKDAQVTQLSAFSPILHYACYLPLWWQVAGNLGDQVAGDFNDGE